jgi:integral membrane protein
MPVMTETPAVPAVPFATRPLLLKAYVVLAWITGTTITVLELVALPLTWWAHSPQLGNVIGVIHGMGLYPLYVILCLVVAFGYRVSIPHMAIMALAGLLPFASPLVARWTLRHIDRREAEKAAKAAARAAKRKTAAPAQGASGRGRAVRDTEAGDALPSA